MNKQNNQTDKYMVIEQMAVHYPVTLLCSIAGASRSGYYKYLKRKNNPSKRQRDNELLKAKILECYKKLKGIYGYPRTVTWLYREYGILVNHKRVYRLMRDLGIQAKIRRKKRYYGGKEACVLSDNTLNREFNASRPNEKWVTDITYLMCKDKWLYLSTIYDLFNNEVVTYKISSRNDLSLVMDTVKEAIKLRNVDKTLLHSDQGFQYTTRQYYNLLKENNMTPSMSRRGNCLDNACIESFHSHLKSECIYLNKFASEQELMEQIDKYITFYNTQRFQAKLNNLSPVEYRTKAA